MTGDTIAASTAEELRKQVQAIDQASAEQLEELAEAFAMTNNRATSREIHALAAWKAEHAGPGAVASDDWFVVQPGDPDAVHYMMWPRHLVGIVQASEQRLLDALRTVSPTDDQTRGALAELVARQERHIAHLASRAAELPEAPEGWDDDPDPPFFDQ